MEFPARHSLNTMEMLYETFFYKKVYGDNHCANLFLDLHNHIIKSLEKYSSDVECDMSIYINHGTHIFFGVKDIKLCKCNKCRDINIDIVEIIEKINKIHEYLLLCGIKPIILVVNRDILFVDGILCNIVYDELHVKLKSIYNVYLETQYYIIL